MNLVPIVLFVYNRPNHTRQTIEALQKNELAKYIVSKGVKNIADYGGGFSELALTFTSISSDIHVDIIEPFPSAVSLASIKYPDSVSIMRELGEKQYDAIISQDVLERVEDPVGLAIYLSKALKNNGLIVFADCFHPFIKCHLPRTFHLRLTFKHVMKVLGLKYVERVPQAEHALVFIKKNELNPDSARRVETLSKIIWHMLNFLGETASKIKRVIPA